MATKTVSNPLALWLRGHNVRHRVIAAALGKSEVSISRWATGVRSPSATDQEAILAYTRGFDGDPVTPQQWHDYAVALASRRRAA
ncbi:MAG TPA: hypothetical protein VGG48_01705 [Rhizomicrobium sp.]|jgi:hypothetical protein